MTLAKLFHKSILVALIIGLSNLVTAQAQTPRHRVLTAREIARKVFPSVVMLVALDKNGVPVSLGSGFFVRGDAIATNRHVIDSASQIHVKIVGRNVSFEIKSVESTDKENDLALLKIEAPKAQSLLLGDSRRVAVGDTVYVVGNPEGLEGTFSQGIISGLRKTEGQDLLQITAPISHGSSGGPVLNTRGEVIGIAVGIIADGQNLNFAIPVSHLSSLMAKTGQPEGTMVAADDPAGGVGERVLGMAPCAAKCSIPSFEEEIRVHPDSAEGHFHLGEAYLESGRNNEAIEAFKQALRIKPDYVEARLGLGFVYASIGRYDEAVEELKQVIRTFPDNPVAHLGLGLTYFQLGRFDEAIEALKQVTRLVPEDPMAYSMLGASYLKTGRYDGAREAFTQAIRIKPDFPGAHYGLGQTYLSLGDKASALDEYRILKSMKSDSANSLFDQIYK